MADKERPVNLTREECIANMSLVGTKIQRCDWVLQNTNDEYKKDQARRSLKKFRPIYDKLGRTYEEFD